VYSQIDELIIITDIYPASEAPVEGITAQALVKSIQAKHPTGNISYMPFEDNSLLEVLKNNASQNDMILILLQGAGKITNLAKVLCP
jgi:UDP-N-acetylmuramate-alanine ligase